MSDREQQGGPQGWRRTTLGEALPIHYGKARNDRYGRVRVNTPVYGSSGRIDTFNRALTSGPSLIIGRKGNVGSAYYSPEPCWPIDTVYFAEASEEEDLRFFKYLLDHLQLVRKDRSTAVPGLSRDDYNATEVLVPELDQQRLVVAEIEKQFSRLDEAVANLKRVKVNLKRYKAAVLKAAVEGKFTEDWRKQHPDVEPASKLLERILAERRVKWSGRGKYKEPAKPDTSNLPLLPEKWTSASVDQLTSHITSGSRDWTRYYGRGSGTFILAQNVRLMRLDLSERQAVDPPKNDAETVRTRVSIGDILVTIVGAKTGEVCRIPEELVDHFVCQSVALLRPLMPASAKFMELYLASPENGQAQWKQYIYGQGRPHLSFEQLKMTAIALPPLVEQQQVVAEVERRLSVIEELEAAVEANLTRADRLRQGVLTKAFSGELVTV